MEFNHHPISLRGDEARIIDYANRWKPGDPIPYPHFIQDLRAVIDSREILRERANRYYEALVEHDLSHWT